MSEPVLIGPGTDYPTGHIHEGEVYASFAEPEWCGHCLRTRLAAAEAEITTLRAALAVAEEMAELLLTLSDPEYLPRIRELANGVVTRFHAARKEVGK